MKNWIWSPNSHKKVKCGICLQYQVWNYYTVSSWPMRTLSKINNVDGTWGTTPKVGLWSLLTCTHLHTYPHTCAPTRQEHYTHMHTHIHINTSYMFKHQNLSLLNCYVYSYTRTVKNILIPTPLQYALLRYLFCSTFAFSSS